MKTGKMSDTPETDRLLRDVLWSGGRSADGNSPYQLCRKLERERDQLRNLLSTVLKFGLTDQVKAEARKLLNDH